MNYQHTADIYEKTTTVSPAGQRVAAWSVVESGIKCAYLAKNTSFKNFMMGNTMEHDQIISMFFPPSYILDFSNRLYNIKDKFGNIIEEGPIEITAVVKCPMPNGKIHHIEISGYKVIES
jgi:hypothetical protein